MKNIGFASYHPAVNALYLTVILIFSIALQHPVCRLLSLVGALCWCSVVLKEKTKRSLCFLLLPMSALAVVINPAFSHAGVTILAYLPSGNPLTLESVYYGLSMALMLAGVVLWTACMHAVLTADKLHCLAGKAAPSLSLLLSLSLRFVPRFGAQLRQVSLAQQGIGQGLKQKTKRQQLQNGGRILAILLTWSLENAIETAESMKSRGHGSGSRSAFSLYRITERDSTAIAIIAAAAAFLLLMAAHGDFYWRYYPQCQGGGFDLWSACSFLVYGLFCMLPWLVDRWEEKAWNSIA